jgi:hypothetical protein
MRASARASPSRAAFLSGAVRQRAHADHDRRPAHTRPADCGDQGNRGGEGLLHRDQHRGREGREERAAAVARRGQRRACDQEHSQPGLPAVPAATARPRRLVPVPCLPEGTRQADPQEDRDARRPVGASADPDRDDHGQARAWLQANEQEATPESVQEIVELSTSMEDFEFVPDPNAHLSVMVGVALRISRAASAAALVDRRVRLARIADQRRAGRPALPGPQPPARS